MRREAGSSHGCATFSSFCPLAAWLTPAHRTAHTHAGPLGARSYEPGRAAGPAAAAAAARRAAPPSLISAGRRRSSRPKWSLGSTACPSCCTPGMASVPTSSTLSSAQAPSSRQKARSRRRRWRPPRGRRSIALAPASCVLPASPGAAPPRRPPCKGAQRFPASADHHHLHPPRALSPPNTAQCNTQQAAASWQPSAPSSALPAMRSVQRAAGRRTSAAGAAGRRPCRPPSSCRL